MQRTAYLIVLILLFAISIQAQHSTLNFSSDPIRLNQQSILMVPLQQKMFITDINKELAEKNQLNSNQIIDRFTTAIDQVFRYIFEDKCTLSSFYLIEDQEAEEDLRFIYENLGLEYELVSKTIEKKGIGKFKSKIKKPQDEDYQRGQIQNGEIVTKRDPRERYMKAVVKDPIMLDSMHSKFENRFFLFVNELDIKTVYGSAHEMSSMNFEREIKLHYTLYHKNGEILSTGVSKTTFPANLNDIDIIIKDYFPILAQYIYDDLFPPPEEENSKINLNPWKK